MTVSKRLLACRMQMNCDSLGWKSPSFCGCCPGKMLFAFGLVYISMFFRNRKLIDTKPKAKSNCMESNNDGQIFYSCFFDKSHVQPWCSAMTYVVNWLLQSLQLLRDLHYGEGGTAWQRTIWTFRWSCAWYILGVALKWLTLHVCFHCINILLLLYLSNYIFEIKPILLNCNFFPLIFCIPNA